jgi:hypothetical protein
MLIGIRPESTTAIAADNQLPLAGIGPLVQAGAQTSNGLHARQRAA